MTVSLSWFRQTLRMINIILIFFVQPSHNIGKTKSILTIEKFIIARLISLRNKHFLSITLFRKFQQRKKEIKLHKILYLHILKRQFSVHI